MATILNNDHICSILSEMQILDGGPDYLGPVISLKNLSFSQKVFR